MEIESKLALRLKEIKLSSSISTNEKIKCLIKEGKKIINFSVGEPEIDTFPKIKEAAIKAINDNYSHYTNSRGILELRHKISEKLRNENKIDLNAENNIIIVPGVKQALYYLNTALINPGDEAIIFEPYWSTYIDSLKLCGGVPITISGKEENYFKPDLKLLRNKITPKTKYILFSNPCNPSGTLFNRKELEEIVMIAKEHNILIISDEIYEKLVFDDNQFVSTASILEAEDITITINGFSKVTAMTGWRLGFIAANEAIIKAITLVQQQIATCPNSIVQKAAEVAFEQKEEIDQMVKIYQRKRDLLVDGLNKIKGFSCNKPQGSFYVFPNISGLDLGGSTNVSLYLLEKTGIGVVPGIEYGNNFDNYVRFAYTITEKEILEAISRLESAFGKK
ncbi:pyridoxal phosphate-dependent aminotransferase [Candidatus Woesearchaeota archaeon]|nr:pyridoxal phosphate-dependent aminotransferase [Candidatus Woesearchaeota archaeon]